MSPNRRKWISWIFGAILLTGCMVICATLYLDENIKAVFVVLVIVCGSLAFLNKIFGFLFLPVLVGSFFFMGNYSEYYWEQKSLEYYEEVRIKDIATKDEFPILSKFKFDLNVKPDFSRMAHIAQYDNMKRDGAGRGMLLSDYYYAPVDLSPPRNNATRFICRIEVADGTPSLKAQQDEITNDQEFFATSIATYWLDSLALARMSSTKDTFKLENTTIVRWGNPEHWTRRAWKKVWLSFLLAHLGWIVLAILHFYEPGKPEDLSN